LHGPVKDIETKFLNYILEFTTQTLLGLKDREFRKEFREDKDSTLSHHFYQFGVKGKPSQIFPGTFEKFFSPSTVKSVKLAFE
jgi:hypothetical protein